MWYLVDKMSSSFRMLRACPSELFSCACSAVLSSSCVASTSVKRDLFSVKRDLFSVKRDLISVKRDLISVKRAPISVKKGLVSVKRELTPASRAS
jgi:hypothetical protein